MTQSLQIHGQHFILHPTGSLFWEEQEMLLISDVHLGKVTHFRKFGAAVPSTLIHKNFELLDLVMTYFRPNHLCFLGDLFHSHINSEWQFFENWITKYNSKKTLVTGNHDIISPLKYEALRVEVKAKLDLEKFILTHEPQTMSGFFNISGHIHPAVRLKGKGRQVLKLPCFFKSKEQLILPAFGKFTGTHVLPVASDNEIFACTRTEVLKI
ncbi:MAG: ligase-associated DNA damage response endonuclease PdeM [Flavobacteriaceae bacterium]